LKKLTTGYQQTPVGVAHGAQIEYLNAILVEDTIRSGGFMNQAPMPQVPEISVTELKQRLDNGDDIQIIDVREANEVAVAKLPNSIHIPLGQVLNRASEIDPARETVVHCKMGGRSAKAIEALKRSGFTGNLLNLKGGITAWSNEVDPSVPKY
jgi:sulfur-carrier protein adenylyltransferase/sulfurtransferase